MVAPRTGGDNLKSRAEGILNHVGKRSFRSRRNRRMRLGRFDRLLGSFGSDSERFGADRLEESIDERLVSLIVRVLDFVKLGLKLCRAAVARTTRPKQARIRFA